MVFLTPFDRATHWVPAFVGTTVGVQCSERRSVAERMRHG